MDIKTSNINNAHTAQKTSNANTQKASTKFSDELKGLQKNSKSSQTDSKKESTTESKEEIAENQTDNSLDDAIDLLKEWEHQYDENSQFGWGYLNACFYLAVCYCAKSIKRGVPNLELTSLASTYFRKSEDFAKKFDKGTVLPQCYLGERDDIHCIIDKNMKDTDADTVTGVIHHINNNKGILKMLCGVEVTFNAKGFDILHDEGQTLRGVLGFSYSGPGLYDFRAENMNTYSEIYDEQDETETTFEDLEKSYIPTENLVEEEIKEPVKEEKPQPKVVGKIDLSQFDKKQTKLHVDKSNSDSYEEGEIVHGTICSGLKSVVGPKGRCTVDNKNGFAVSPKKCDYEAIKNVIFKVKVGKNANNPTLPWYYAINIQPDD